MNDILFLPVKPKWAKLIMSGKKSLELRKRLPAKGHGNRCIVYASSPQCEVVGACTFVCGKSFRPGPNNADAIRHACVTAEEFAAYFDDAHYARFEDGFDARWYGLELSRPTPLTKPIALETLRGIWGINPPQQWRYIDGKTFDEIVEAGR